LSICFSARKVILLLVFIAGLYKTGLVGTTSRVDGWIQADIVFIRNITEEVSESVEKR
jgi:hypothetical protein